MKRFSHFINERRNMFLDVFHLSLDAARTYFKASLESMGYNFEKEFPNFDENYIFVKNKIRFGKFNRNKMPVIKSQDFDRFVKYMMDEHGVGIKKGKEKPVNLFPIQKQLYLDNPIEAIRKHTLKTSINFIKTKSHSLISRDNYIMDGNHRFLLGALYDRNMLLNVNIIDMNGEELKAEMDHFTDKVIKRKRNESWHHDII